MHTPARVCEYCSTPIPHGETLFRLRVEFSAEPDPPVLDELGSLDREQIHAEFEELIRRMESMTGAEVESSSREIWERIEFRLCAECRSDLRRQFLRWRLGPDTPVRDSS